MSGPLAAHRFLGGINASYVQVLRVSTRVWVALSNGPKRDESRLGGHAQLGAATRQPPEVLRLWPIG